jgi:DNA repair exonuclease SbcCD nuclease subunit
MQIAITADVHLREKEKHPERYNALENIYKQCRDKGIHALIIAGDLFDAESPNYSDFDNLLGQFPEIRTYIIPGNHDPGLRQNLFASENLTVFSETTIQSFDGAPFLFIPYFADKSMGELIASQKNKLPDKWVLISHGDYLGGSRETNPYEPGTYMPVNRKDLEYYSPSKVILGHIHKYYDTGRLYYTGSPCAMDVNETGKRRFLILDTETLTVKSQVVDTEKIYFNETLMVLPVRDEWNYIQQQLTRMTESWNLDEKDKRKATVRIRARGFTTDRKRLSDTIRNTLKDVSFYKNEGPDLSEVYIAEDPELTGFMEQVKDNIMQLEWSEEETYIRKEDILEEALKIILT